MSEQDLVLEAKTRLRRIEGQVRGIQGMLDRMSEDPAVRQDLRRNVCELLAKGTPRAEIARSLGISRQRVSDIAAGRVAQNGEPCDRLLTQVLAVHAAVEQVGLLIMEFHLQRCVLNGLPVDDDKLRDLRESLKLWSRLS
jgi:DNA-binding FrmR family transcriptional regulator